MAKQSVMIPVNADVLRDSIQKRDSLSSLEGVLGVSRQAINGWLSKSKIPPRQLSTIVRELKLDASEVKKITSPPKDRSFVLFRTNRNVAVAKDISDDVLEIAEDFFRLEALTEIERQSTNVKIENATDPGETATTILKNLNLERTQISISSVLSALTSLNIYVLFYNFGEGFIGAKAQAVCVKKAKKRVIFINSHELVEDVLWRIFHELCHLYCDHTETSTSNEEFCNFTATQALTPDSFFSANKKELKNLFSRGVSVAPFSIEKIATQLSASFMGVLLALKKHQIVDSSTERYLWKIAHKRKASGARVTDIISPPKDVDSVAFWLSALEDVNRSKFLHLQHMVRMGLILEKISVRRASELLHVDELDAQRLAKLWTAQYEKKNNL